MNRSAMKTHWTSSQLCVSAFAAFGVLLNGTRAVPSPDPYASPPGRSEKLPGRRFPSIPVDTFRTKSGEVQRVEWDSDVFTALIFARNPASSIPKEVFVIDDIRRDVDDEVSEGIFIADGAGSDEGKLYRLAPKKMKKKTRKQQQQDNEQEGSEYSLVIERNYDMSGKDLSMRRSFVGILWTQKANTAFVRLLKEMVPMANSGAGTAGAGEEMEESAMMAENGDENDKISWAYSVATRGVEEGFIDPAQEYSIFREPTRPVYY